MSHTQGRREALSVLNSRLATDGAPVPVIMTVTVNVALQWGKRMNIGVRMLLTLCTLFAVHVMAYWLVVLVAGGADRSNGIRTLAAFVAAVLASAYVWRRLAARAARTQARPERGLAECVLLGALLTGAIAFVAGFAGPIILDPETVQGPMLGIFITGPLGLVLGAIGGAVYWFVKRP